MGSLKRYGNKDRDFLKIANSLLNFYKKFKVI